jgi:UbiD family decarboxylase
MAVRPWLERFADETITITEKVSREIEVTRHLLAHPNVPVHFSDLDGFEAAGNLWSTRDRVAAALGVTKDDLLTKLLDAQSHPKDTRLVERAPFQKNASTDVDLLDSPVPKLYPKDAGRYITAGVWVAEWQGVRNLSFHRIQVLDERRGACRIVPRHLRHMYDEAMKAGEELQVAICIGLDPALLIGGGTSVEYGVDESRIASGLTQATLRKPVDMVRIQNGLTVPADAEYILEGRLTKETAEEGPFVDAVRTYDIVRREPVLVVDRIYHVDRPIFHIIVGGLDEHFMFMGMPREPAIYQAVSRAVPHVKAVRLTEGGCAWLHGIVSIRKQHQGDAKNAIMAAFGAHTSMKQVTVVDEDIDVYDDRDVEWAVATRFQADRGLVVLHGVRGSSIDPSAKDGFTSKVGIDATKPLSGDPAAFDKATAG